MPLFCTIIGCASRGDRDKCKRFFRLPSVIVHQGDQTQELSQKRRDAWLARLKRADLNQESYQYVRVCSDYFVNGMPSALYDLNNPDWAPSLKLGYELKVTGKDRYERMTARTARKRHSGQIDICSSPELESNHKPETGTASQTNLTSMDITEAEQTLKSLRKEIDKVTMEKEKEVKYQSSEVKKLKEENEELSLNEAVFKEKDEKVMYFTGLPSWQVLYTLLQFIRSHLKEHSMITPFQQLLVTLMRLRLNLAGKD